MTDKLEKFVQDHQEEFESEEPRAQVWERIRADLGDNRVVSMNRYSWAWKAAAVFLFGLSSYLLIERQTEPRNSETAQAEDLQRIPLGEIEMHYTSIIEQRKIEILKVSADHPDMIESFQNDVGSLESLYVELHAEFRETNNERVLDAMINNLKLRIDLLNYQIALIDEIKNNAIEKYQQDDGTQNI